MSYRRQEFVFRVALKRGIHLQNMFTTNILIRCNLNISFISHSYERVWCVILKKYINYSKFGVFAKLCGVIIN